MEKIPFDIKYRSDVENGKMRVVTRDNHKVRIVCWDRICDGCPVIALISYGEYENVYYYQSNGLIRGSIDKDALDLLIVIENDFEKMLFDFISDLKNTEKYNERSIEDVVSEIAPYLIKAIDKGNGEDGTSINGSPTELEQVLVDVLTNDKSWNAQLSALSSVRGGICKKVVEAYKHDNKEKEEAALNAEYERGVSDTLRLLPKWRKCEWNFEKWKVTDENGKPIICDGAGNSLYLDDLIKLPVENEFHD